MAAKKKSCKSKKEKGLEEKIKILENNIDNLERAQKKIKDEEEKKEENTKKINEKIEIIRKDLKDQLIAQNKYGEHFNDMIENYLFYVKLKEELQYDIDTRGIRYEARTGNGYKTDKPNESIKNLTNVTTEMRKILQDLDLKEPEEPPEEGEGDDLL